MVKYWQFLERTKNPYKSMELAWIGDFNPVMNRMIETYVCATRHKVHTTYRYLFDRTKEFHRCPRLGVKRRSEWFVVLQVSLSNGRFRRNFEYMKPASNTRYI